MRWAHIGLLCVSWSLGVTAALLVLAALAVLSNLHLHLHLFL